MHLSERRTQPPLASFLVPLRRAELVCRDKPHPGYPMVRPGNRYCAAGVGLPPPPFIRNAAVFFQDKQTNQLQYKSISATL